MTKEIKDSKIALMTNDDSREMVKLRKLNLIADHWVNNQEIDWYLLYPEVKPNKISLPTYPFAKEKYWFSVKNEKHKEAINLHPLLHFEIEE